MALKLNVLQLDQLASDPISPIDGQEWYNVTDNKLRARINGVTVDLGAGGGGGVFGTEFGQSYNAGPYSGTNTSPVPVTGPFANVVPAGTYRIGWSVSMWADGRGALRIVQNNDWDNPLAIGATKIKTSGFRQMQSGFLYAVLAAGTHWWDMEYWADSNDEWHAEHQRFEIWRVA